MEEKLKTTATGQSTDTAAIAAVREVLAQRGAGIGRNYDSIEYAVRRTRRRASSCARSRTMKRICKAR